MLINWARIFLIIWKSWFFLIKNQKSKTGASCCVIYVFSGKWYTWSTKQSRFWTAWSITDRVTTRNNYEPVPDFSIRLEFWRELILKFWGLRYISLDSGQIHDFSYKLVYKLKWVFMGNSVYPYWRKQEDQVWLSSIFFFGFIWRKLVSTWTFFGQCCIC